MSVNIVSEIKGSLTADTCKRDRQQNRMCE